MYKPYSILTPDYDSVSGGIKVMWGLYGALLQKGHTVYINAQFQDPNFVAIYPEIAQGNPLGAKHVVRYILNKPGVMGGVDQNGNFQPSPTSFDQTDMLYYFSKLFGEANGNHYMFLPVINTHLFKDQGKQRTKTAFFVGKGVDTSIHPEGALEIDRNLARDQQYLADLLNECEVLYCYDPVTAMTEVARLCGCRIVMVNPIYSKDEFKNYEAGMNGISWGKDEGIPLDTKGFRSHYGNLRRIFSSKLDRFIEETQKE